MSSYEDQMRRGMEHDAATAAERQECPVEGEMDAAFGLIKSLGGTAKAYPRSNALRTFARQSKVLRNMGVKMRPKAGQRKGGAT